MQNKRLGDKGGVWKFEKEKSIKPSDYGDYILQHRKRGKNK